MDMRKGLSGRLIIQSAVFSVGLGFAAVAAAQVSPAKHSSADVSGQSGPVQVTEVRYCTAMVERRGADKDLKVDVDAKSCRDALRTEPAAASENKASSSADRRGGFD